MGSSPSGLADFVTHYYLPDRRPFLNLSDLDDCRRAEVMSELIALRRSGRQLRPFGRRYAEWRRLTEERLRERFVAAGGAPTRQAPHYFVLGTSTWFESLAPGMRAVVVPVDALPPVATSFTLIDSFTAMGYGRRFGYPDTARPHERIVYRLERLAHVIGAHGLPSGEDDRFVEVQLWAEDPISAYVDP